MVRVKILESYSLPTLENYINEYLEKNDEKELVDIKITTAQRDNTSPSANYVAVVIFRN